MATKKLTIRDILRLAANIGFTYAKASPRTTTILIQRELNALGKDIYEKFCDEVKTEPDAGQLEESEKFSKRAFREDMFQISDLRIRNNYSLSEIMRALSIAIS